MTSAHITQVNEKNYHDEVVKTDKLVLIDFYADWCGPCKAMAPFVEKFADEHQATVKVVKVNIDECPELAAAFFIKSIPTLVTMKDGAGIYGAVGGMQKSGIEELVAQSFKKLSDTHSNKPSQPRDPAL